MTGKQRKGAGQTATALVKKDGQETQRSHDETISLASATSKTATTRLERRRRNDGNVAKAVNTVHTNYKIAIRPISQITPKFS